ncbi:MAG: hypothetical protein MJ200_01005 [Mycoplasmoidaceae bacterium]|nr:hypothetical protein [Mycoplasmoidaceae bacterium]
MKFLDLFKRRKHPVVNKKSQNAAPTKKSKFAIEMRNVTKTFLGGKIIANSNVNINVK